MNGWQIIAGVFSAGWFLLSAAIFRQVHLDIRQDRRAAARLEARCVAAADQRNVDMTFAQLTDPAHFGKTGGPT